LKWIELKWVFDGFEDLELNVADLEVNAAMVMVKTVSLTKLIGY